jgi:hypothetical protein
MDGKEFDHFVRALGARLTRRRGLQAGLGLGVAAAALPAAQPVQADENTARCAAGLDRCGQVCCVADARCRSKPGKSPQCLYVTTEACARYRNWCSDNFPCCSGNRCIFNPNTGYYCQPLYEGVFPGSCKAYEYHQG